MNGTIIGLDLDVFSSVRGFASKIAGPRNTIKIISDGIQFCSPLNIEVLRLYNKLDDDSTGFGRILVG
jgi:hypothetical protein